MNPQTFAISDLATIGVLVVLEALLSADNALILAIMVRHLPKDQQKRALFYGLAGAFILRFSAIFLAAQILSLWWLQVLGAGYLIYLPIKHFITHSSGKGHKGAAGMGFWKTVFYVELTDLMFAVDSVLVAVAVVDVAKHRDKLWVVVAGALIGIVLLRFAANWCLKLLERYPVLDHIAYVLVGWAGVKMFFVGGHTWAGWYEKMNPGKEAPIHIPELSPAIFWGGLALIVLVGLFIAMRHPQHAEDAEEITELEEAIETLEGTDSEPIAEPDKA